MFSARQNWSTVKLGSLTSARFAPRAGLCSKDTLRLHVYSYVGTCITTDAQKNPRRNIPLVGRGVINPQKLESGERSLNGRDLWVYASPSQFRADYSYARSRHPHDMRAFRRSVLAGARRVTISNTLLTLGFLNSLLARFLARSESFLNQVAISSSVQPLSLSSAFALDRERCRLSSICGLASSFCCCSDITCAIASSESFNLIAFGTV